MFFSGPEGWKLDKLEEVIEKKHTASYAGLTQNISAPTDHTFNLPGLSQELCRGAPTYIHVNQSISLHPNGLYIIHRLLTVENRTTLLQISLLWLDKAGIGLVGKGRDGLSSGTRF